MNKKAACEMFVKLATGFLISVVGFSTRKITNGSEGARVHGNYFDF